MAEAIGLVASVVQLAGAGLKLSQALYQYADGVANADRRIKDVAKEIKLTSYVIEELGNVFKQDDTLSLISKSAVATANETLKECSVLFGEIETTLNKSKKGKMGRLMLPFRENKMELLRNHIDKLKSTLQLLMQVLVHAHQVASNKIDREAEARQRDEIRQLLEEKKNNTKKYEESLRSFAASDSSTEVEDDAFSLDDKGSASMVEVKSIGSTVDPDSLVVCMGHIRTLMESMERLQRALANKSEGEDHSDHHQMVVESYFMTRCHLDRILLGSSNTTNLKDTGVAMRQSTSSKTVIPNSDAKSCTGGKEKDTLVIRTNTTRNAETEASQCSVSSRKESIPQQVPIIVEISPRPAPRTRDTVYDTAYGSRHRYREFVPSDMSRHYPPSLSPQVTEKRSGPDIAPPYSSIDHTLLRSSLSSVSPRPSTYDGGLPISHERGNVAFPATINTSQRRHSYRSSRDEIHDLDSETREHKRRGESRGGKANDRRRKAAPEGNDEVDKLLREWTTCFS
ncbi:uncharacterized protein yc1106_03923 [Curvularia clavata]|uniref:Fungal N-terminal domain-containing protein n=1 Tax=Curvularia clavata TaxID=95742 RepID=A0A9Q8Z5Z8_CURCL|nr:uncharacterized protein yc1106_03923 [Curvularia clavata]